MLQGGDGDDHLTGGGGDDRIDGGAGSDLAFFSGHRSAYTLSLQSDGLHVSGPDGADILTNIEFLVFDDSAIAAPDKIASAPKPPANNFNGDGHSGILWQNTDGTPAIWTVDGTNLVSGSNVGFNPGADWHVIGSGDFNADGKADISGNTNGTIAEWFANGTNLIRKRERGVKSREPGTRSAAATSTATAKPTFFDRTTADRPRCG